MKTTVVSTTEQGVNFEIKYDNSDNHCTRTTFKTEGVLVLAPTQNLKCESISDLYRLVEMTETNQDITKYRIH